LEQLSRQVKSVIANINDALTGEKKSLGKNGISLRDFSSVDRTSNASDRQAAASAIGEELHLVQGVNQDKRQQPSEISLDD
jgi:hypothetical protein